MYVPVQYPEVALSIEVYQNVQTRKDRLQNQELLVLGQQTLTELRNKSDCLTDHVMPKAGQHDPSTYLLVEVRNLFINSSFHDEDSILTKI
ncbi:hypothetical protein FF1_045872 [Malus domestica]